MASCPLQVPRGAPAPQGHPPQQVQTPNPVCPPHSYGVQELNGEKRLTGPGLQSQQPLSVTMTGGPWPSR